jgi:hypothetical protein
LFLLYIGKNEYFYMPIYKVIMASGGTSTHETGLKVAAETSSPWGNTTGLTNHLVNLYPYGNEGDCFFGMVIQMNYASGGHTCNFACFEAWANSGMTGGLALGYANLNNGGTVSRPNRYGVLTTNTFPYNDPGGSGSSRYNTFNISPSLAQAIGSQNPQNILKISFRCLSTGWNESIYYSLPWVGEPVTITGSTQLICHSTDSGQIIKIINPYSPIGTTGTTYYNGSMSNYTIVKVNACTGVQQFEIIGRMANGGGTPLTGATITFMSGATFVWSGLTNSTGWYSVYVPISYTGVATPTKPGYTFSPTGTTYTNVINDQTDSYTNSP